MSKINRGSLWLGKEWEEAIKLSIETPDCGVEPVFAYKYPDKLLCAEKVLVGYQIFGFDSRRKHKTRIPKKYNEFAEKTIKERSGLNSA